MKKYALTFAIIILLSGVTYIVIKELTYNPLKEKDFRILFPNYDGKAKKKCHLDFIGLSLHGELFDISLYKLNEMTINFQYPNFKNSYENLTMSNDDFFFSKWKKCPVDSLTFFRIKDILTIEDFSKKKCFSSFISDLENPKNYYSYLYINELEYYFYLFNSNMNYLYFVRKKGW